MLVYTHLIETSLRNVKTLKSRLGRGHSLITPLTSGFRNEPLSSYLVLLGTISSYPLPGEAQELRAVAQFIIHPSYKALEAGDIALVQLASPVTFSDRILPVCLPKPGDPLGHGTLCWVTGWGNIGTTQRKDVQQVAGPGGRG